MAEITKNSHKLLQNFIAHTATGWWCMHDLVIKTTGYKIIFFWFETFYVKLKIKI